MVILFGSTHALIRVKVHVLLGQKNVENIVLLNILVILTLTLISMTKD